jgi:hypothetical protein
MSQDLAEATLVAVTWRNRDSGGIATFEYRGGAMASQPMSQDAARIAADEAFGHDQSLVEFDGGSGWTRRPLARGSKLRAALTFSRGHRPRS